jgi:glycine cleavage system H protein
MNVPSELRYSSDHEWVRTEGPSLRVGITDYAQDALGDVVYVEVPEVGAAVEAGAKVSEVESTKSVSDIYAPADGEVTEINPESDEDPGLVNSDPYGAGWLFKIELDSADPLPPGLLSAAEYAALTQEEQ